jgi:hypothetical protein
MHTYIILSRRSRGDETQISPVHPPDGIVSLVTSPATISSSRRDISHLSYFSLANFHTLAASHLSALCARRRRTLQRTSQKTARENVDLTSLHPRIPAISRESKKISRPSRPWRASREVPSASFFDVREFGFLSDLGFRQLGFRGKTRNLDYPAQDKCTSKNKNNLPSPYTESCVSIHNEISRFSSASPSAAATPNDSGETQSIFSFTVSRLHPDSAVAFYSSIQFTHRNRICLSSSFHGFSDAFALVAQEGTVQ